MEAEQKQFIWIDSLEALHQHKSDLAQSKYLAIDLEADNQHLYEEQVCLVQISNHSQNYLIDTLMIKDLSELHDICLNPNIPKIFHDLEFDQKSMNKEFKCEFKNLFDTKMAAELSSEEKFGLSALLEKHFKLNLNKKYQQANWTIRPIPVEMLQYSINDSFYLNDLKEILTEQLQKQNRLNWLIEECTLREKFRYTESTYPEHIRIKASIRLKDKQLNLLRHLCIFRDLIAQKHQVSRFQVVSNKTLLEISSNYPKPYKIDYLHKIIKPNYQEDFLNYLLDAYRLITTEDVLEHPIKENAKAQHRTEIINSNINKIKKWRLNLSEKTKIPVVYIWPSETIDLLAKDPILLEQGLENIQHLRNWQIEEFGDDFLKKIKNKLENPTKH